MKKVKKKISFVLPARNEEESIPILHKEITSVMKKVNFPYEVIYIDDGSKDKTYRVLRKLHKKDKRVKVIKLRGNWGKATAMQAGFDASSGDIIFTLDTDLQDNPKEIPRFLEKLDDGFDLVVGWKEVRHDPKSKLISTKLFNGAVRKLTGLDIHDVNCGFKAYKREVIDNIDFYGDLFRLIPVIAHKNNFKVGEIVVEHRARKFGKSKFGFERSIKGGLDLLTVFFLTGYSKKPGHFFGGFGLVSFFFGFIIGLYITFLRVTTGSIQNHHPLLYLGMLLMIIGVQLVTTGLLAEMLLNINGPKDTSSKIKEVLE